MRALHAFLFAVALIAVAATPAWAATHKDPRQHRTTSAYESQLKNDTSEHIVATWTCERQLGREPTRARSPWKPHSTGFREAQLNLWTQNHAHCLRTLHMRADALRSGRYERLPDRDLYELADQAVEHGGIYSIAWGDASPILKGLCYEAVRRSFARFGTEQWALHIVNRESGCNPGAVNTTYSNPRERATCIAQMIPSQHTWIDYARCQRDLRYAVRVFIGLSDGGHSTGPWS